MKSRVLLLSIIFAIVIPVGCSEDNPSKPVATNAGIQSELVDFQGCKTSKQRGIVPGVKPNQDCVEYSYDSEGTLRLVHINAGFNCCPGVIKADITIENDTIAIVEKESDPNCRCLCLFDISYRIENLPPSEYTITISELYLNQDDPPVEFSVDLSSRQSGRECFFRDHYPWQDSYSAGDPEGELIDYAGCKYDVTNISDLEVPGGLDCVQYLYSNTGILSLKHINAAFNCCPEEIITDISINNDTIRIAEDEKNGLCDCICLFDLQYELRNIEPGDYTIIFEEPYLCQGDRPLNFDIELPCLPNSCFCASRTCYPWETTYNEEDDLRRLSGMKEILDRLLKTSLSCNNQANCIALPYGAKPCGGPGKYVAASRTSENFPLLVPCLCIFNSFQDLVNRRYNYESDCSFVTKPEVECLEGHCKIVE